jgi:hypothetical protein
MVLTDPQTRTQTPPITAKHTDSYSSSPPHHSDVAPIMICLSMCTHHRTNPPCPPRPPVAHPLPLGRLRPRLALRTLLARLVRSLCCRITAPRPRLSWVNMVSSGSSISRPTRSSRARRPYASSPNLAHSSHSAREPFPGRPLPETNS